MRGRRDLLVCGSERVVGEVGLEPTKAYARGFTVRPLCHSGHSPARSEPLEASEQKASAAGREGLKSADRRVLKAAARPGPQIGARLIVASHPERNDARKRPETAAAARPAFRRRPEAAVGRLDLGLARGGGGAGQPARAAPPTAPAGDAGAGPADRGASSAGPPRLEPPTTSRSPSACRRAPSTRAWRCAAPPLEAADLADFAARPRRGAADAGPGHRPAERRRHPALGRGVRRRGRGAAGPPRAEAHRRAGQGRGRRGGHACPSPAWSTCPARWTS